MGRRITERRLVDVLTQYLRDTHSVAREVPHYEKRIDLVAFSNESGELWAIEAKCTDWLRALGQALVNLPAADRSFIALQSDYVHRVDLEALEEFGIGLISVGSKWGAVEVVREAVKSPYSNPMALERVRGHMPTGG